LQGYSGRTTPESNSAPPVDGSIPHLAHQGFAKPSEETRVVAYYHTLSESNVHVGEV